MDQTLAEKREELAQAHDEAMGVVHMELARLGGFADWSAVAPEIREWIYDQAARLCGAWNANRAPVTPLPPELSTLAGAVAHQGVIYQELCAVEDALILWSDQAVH